MVVYSADRSFSESSDVHGICLVPYPTSFDSIYYTDMRYTSGVHVLGAERHIILRPEPLAHAFSPLLIVGRANEDARQVADQVAVLNRNSFNKIQTHSTVDALEKTATAFVQKSQNGGGSPILRGFEANKILLVVDGVRMNNAIYRSGHLQNAMSVDADVLERMEVLYGPSALIYGSGALGGVIHFRTPDLRFSKTEEQHSSIGFSYASASQTKKTFAKIQFANAKWSSLSFASFTEVGNLRVGKHARKTNSNFGLDTTYVLSQPDRIIQNPNPLVLQETNFQQVSALQKLAYRFSPKRLLIANLQYYESPKISRYDELSLYHENQQPLYSEWYYSPFRRFLSSLVYEDKTRFALADEFKIIGAYQSIAEGQNTRRFNSEYLLQSKDQLDIFNLYLDAKKTLGKFHLNYGFATDINSVTSTAKRKNITTQTEDSNTLTRYPSGGSKTIELGGYLQSQFAITKNFDLKIGLRLQHYKNEFRYLHSDIFEWPEYFYDKNNQASTAFVYSFGLIKKWASGIGLKLHYGNAFRAPNIDDLAKTRIKTTTISVPNLNLKPEKTNNFSASFWYDKRWGLQHIKLDYTFYYTHMHDAIVRQDFYLPNGDVTYVADGVSYQVQANVNAAKANILGHAFGMSWTWDEKYTIAAGFNVQKGTQKEGGVAHPLAHIPPSFGIVQTNIKKDLLNLNVAYVFNGPKKRSDYASTGSDNLIFATTEGLPARGIFNINLLYDLTPLQLSLGLDNILDLRYRTFSSGLSAPGRDLRMGIKLTF